MNPARRNALAQGDEAPPRKASPGRPRKPEDERTVVATVRLKPAHKARLRALGAAWLARQLDAATLPANVSTRSRS